MAQPNNADWTIDQGWERYTAEEHARLEDAVRAPDPAAARPRLRRVRAGHARPADRARADPRLPAPVRGADAAHRLAGRGGAGAGARRSVLRAPGEPAFPGRPVHPQAARARLPRRARRLPRRVRPRADADEPGDRRLHPGLRRRRPARAEARQARQPGAGLLVHGRVRPGAAERRPAHLRRRHRVVVHRERVRARRARRRTASASTWSA